MEQDITFPFQLNLYNSQITCNVEKVAVIQVVFSDLNCIFFRNVTAYGVANAPKGGKVINKTNIIAISFSIIFITSPLKIITGIINKIILKTGNKIFVQINYVKKDWNKFKSHKFMIV